MKLSIATSTAVVAIFSLACPANAQTDESTDEFPAVTDKRLGTISVTARKTEESLKDAPIALTAVTGEGLEARDVDDVVQLTDLAPNVNIGLGNFSGNSSASVAFIRGVGQIDFTLVTDPGVGVYVDGVYYARTIGAILDLFDVDRVEVLRGPQGTLFGRNSTGGAISIHTAKPSNEFSGRARVIAGSDNRYEGFASISVPLGPNVSTLISGIIRQQDGTAVDPLGREYGDDNMYGVRSKTEWTPSDVLRFVLSADYLSEDEGPAAEVPVTLEADGSVDESATDFFFTPNTRSGTDGSFGTEIESFGVSLTTEYDMNNVISFKSITAYRDLESTFTRFPSPLTTNFNTTSPFNHTQFSQELQANLNFDDISAVVGVFYMDEDGDSFETADVGVAPAGWPRLIGISDISNTNWAVFGEATFDLTDRLRAIGGLRYTDESKEASFLSQSVPGLTRGTVATDPVVNTIGFGPNQSLDFNKLTYRGVLQYELTTEANVYASYSTGFKSGGFNQRLVGPLVPGFFTQPDEFGPEDVESIEVGIKFENDSLRLNSAAFFSDYSDIQISGAPPGEIASQVFNGGAAEIYGLEIEGMWAPTDNFFVDFSAGLIEAEYTEIIANTAEVSVEDEFVFTPPYTIGLGATYMQDIDKFGELRGRIDFFRSGKVYFEPNNASGPVEDGYSNVDASISLTPLSNNFSLTVGVNNLTDETYLTSADGNVGLAYNVGQFARPQNFFLKLEATF